MWNEYLLINGQQETLDVLSLKGAGIHFQSFRFGWNDTSNFRQILVLLLAKHKFKIKLPQTTKFGGDHMSHSWGIGISRGQGGV